MKLRAEIIAYMREKQSVCCTWWFKLYIKASTSEIRAELIKMEKDGIVTADRSQSNNTKWLLVESADRIEE